MRYRIKYSKQGLMKYIGHLDMMRYFQKTLRRAGIEVTFTEGMSPHMSMSYAFPLGVGMTSDSEYVDVDLDIPLQSRFIIDRLNDAASEGVVFLDARVIETGKANKGMSLVERADYTLRFREGYAWDLSWKDDFEKWLSNDEIMVIKKSKKREQEINIRPLIFDYDLNTSKREDNELTANELTAKDANDGGRRQDKESKGDIYLALSAGSEANIRPELIMENFAASFKRPYTPYTFTINRDEVYTRIDERFIPLIELGKIL